MNILITGATGYIGKELAQKLAAAGHQVHALYRSEAKTALLQHKNIRLFKGDLGDEASLAAAIKGCEQVYHLAALAGVWARDPGVFYEANFHAVRRLLELANQAGVKRMVVTSTGGVIGPASEGIPVEEAPFRKPRFFSDYEKSKWMMEDYLLHQYEGTTEVVIVNPTRVFGPGLLSESNGVTRMVQLYLNGKFRLLPGGGKRIGNYTFVNDVVQGHLLAMEKGRNKERYLLGGDDLSYRELFAMLARLSGKTYRMFNLPASALYGLAYIQQARTRLFKTPPLFTPVWVDKLVQHDWLVSSRKAQEELGYQPTPAEEAFRQTIQWLQEQKAGATKH